MNILKFEPGFPSNRREFEKALWAAPAILHVWVGPLHPISKITDLSLLCVRAEDYSFTDFPITGSRHHHCSARGVDEINTHSITSRWPGHSSLSLYKERRSKRIIRYICNNTAIQKVFVSGFTLESGKDALEIDRER